MVGAYKNGVELSEEEVQALYDELWDVLFKSKYDTASYSKLMKDFNRKNVFKINFNDEEE